jgi:hypothetical protein
MMACPEQKESFMMVKVRQKDGKWYVFINHHSQRKARCVGDSKRAAEEVKGKLEAKLTLGDVGLLDAAPQAVLFGDYVEQWLTHYVTVTCKPSSGRIMRGIVRNHLLPAFGTQDLRSITRAQVKTFVVQQHQRYTPKYVKNLVRTLHMICAHAVAEEVLDRNPTAVSPPVCMATASTISGIATRRSNSMSTMPPSNMSQSSWGMPVSRSLWIPTDILAKEPALPWPTGLTPWERRRDERQL